MPLSEPLNHSLDWRCEWGRKSRATGRKRDGHGFARAVHESVFPGLSLLLPHVQLLFGAHIHTHVYRSPYSKDEKGAFLHLSVTVYRVIWEFQPRLRQ